MNGWRIGGPFIVKIAFTVLVAAILSGFAVRNLESFRHKALPRFSMLRVWPDKAVMESRVTLERVNIHLPDFAALAAMNRNSGNSRGQLENYLRYYQYLTDAMPDRFDAHLAQGYCEYYVGRYSDAERSFLKALVLRSDHFWTYYDLGMMYFNGRVYPAALKYLNRAIELARSFDPAILSRSKVFLDIIRQDAEVNPLGNVRAALRDLYQANVISLFVMKDYAGARDMAEKGLKDMGGDDVDLMGLSGIVALELHDLQGAFDRLNDALQIAPQRGAENFFLAICLKGRGDEDGARQHYQKAQAAGFALERFLGDVQFPLKLY